MDIALHDLNPRNVRFTQYLLPHGTPRPTWWECESEEQARKAKAVIAKGGRFESEILQTGAVSLTCELGEDDDQETIAHEICSNDKSVIEAVGKLIETAYEHLQEKN